MSSFSIHHSPFTPTFSVDKLPPFLQFLKTQEGFPIARRPISKPALVGILLAVFLLGLIIYQTFGLEQYECEVCVDFEGRNKCLTVQAEEEALATATAKDNACSYVTNGRAETFRCSQTPPASTRCKRL